MRNFWNNKKVLVTGHTGFVGSWMTLCLSEMGATVCGYAKGPITNPNLFSIFSIEERCQSVIGDIKDYPMLSKLIESFQPDIIIHLAAQALVRESYLNALDTYETNINGTLHILECFRYCKSSKVLINVTTDKCYENPGADFAFKEQDPLGGYDPYSNSKACSELVTSSYRNSFFHLDNFEKHQKAVATARAGNIIGGGDFSKDRLIPDCVRSILSNTILKIRSPYAKRPWLYILDAVFAYLLLAQKLWEDPRKFSGAWNFGPNQSDCHTVEYIIKKFDAHWNNSLAWEIDSNINPHEATFLRLNTDKAKNKLLWSPTITIDEAIASTADWYKAYTAQKDIVLYSLEALKTYEALSTKSSEYNLV